MKQRICHDFKTANINSRKFKWGYSKPHKMGRGWGEVRILTIYFVDLMNKQYYKLEKVNNIHFWHPLNIHTDEAFARIGILWILVSDVMLVKLGLYISPLSLIYSDISCSEFEMFYLAFWSWNCSTNQPNQMISVVILLSEPLEGGGGIQILGWVWRWVTLTYLRGLYLLF